MDKPIGDYAALGDCHGAALVARDGAIDWACLERFDADPIFCRLVAGASGGAFDLQPDVPFVSRRQYLPRTNILQTTFTTASGAIRLTDFMPVGRRRNAGVHDYVSLAAPGAVVRLLEGLGGAVPVRVRYAPTRGFGARFRRLEARSDRLLDECGSALFGGRGWNLDEEGATCRLDVRSGETRPFLLAARAPAGAGPSAHAVRRLFEVTGAFWEEWLSYCRYDGPSADHVRRSALALKLLTYAPSGAIAAAATSSLPEAPGGSANWDYRYCWLRDGAFLLYALAILGYSGEAHAFRRFLTRACRASNFDLQIMYGLEAETGLDEEEILHAAGYRDSRPVRRGNEAHTQNQLDVFGEVLDWALQYTMLGGRLDRELAGMVEALGRRVCRIWREADHGIWEQRGRRHHYTLGRVMAWAALDRAIRILGPRREFVREREAIRRTIWREAIAADGTLRTAPDIDWADASLLLVVSLGFPCPDGVAARTVDRIRRELGTGEYVRRFIPAPDEPQEGAFLACSFWLVSALLMLGRRTEAEPLFLALCGRANDVGLYAEEADPDTHALLGNFPQALTHLAMIEAAVNLDLVRTQGMRALAGGPADRARRAVGATIGLPGLWTALLRSGRVGRLRSSRASML